MSIKKEKEYYTIDDIFALPENERAELIDGQIYDMAPPNRMHQKISTKLASAIDRYISDKNGNCEVYSAPFAVFLNEDDKTYVEPDISVICDVNKLNDKGCNGAPDWIIEIASPSSEKMDFGIKQFKYCSARVREYWVVDISQKKVTVFDFENENLCEYEFNRKIPVAIFNGELQIDFSKFN